MKDISQLVGQIVVAVIGGLALLFGLSLFFSVPVWLLWNGCLVGAVDGVHEVTWLQAWGIGILSGMLFKSTASNKN